MRVTYLTRSFLDYRIPVLEALFEKLDHEFFIIYSADYIPERVNNKVRSVLGENAIGMRGEKRIGPNEFPDFANSAFRVVYQPGLMKKIEQTRPDVLIGDGFFQWTFFALLFTLRHRIPLVICYERTFHTERNVQWLREQYRRVIVRFTAAMACNGILSKEYAQTLGMDTRKITTGQMAADVDNLVKATASVAASDREQLRRQWGNPDLVFLAVGKLNRRKGIAELLQAWALLEQERLGRYALVLVGSGPDEGNLKNLFNHLNLKGVYFVGEVDYNDICRYYASADVLVMPTLEDNWSLVVPEAMACGLPVLCSKYNGCYPELIEEGDNGWVFDPYDFRDGHRGLKKFVENVTNLKNMSEISKRIVSRHRPEHAAEAILKACRRALNR